MFFLFFTTHGIRRRIANQFSLMEHQNAVSRMFYLFDIVRRVDNGDTIFL